MHPFQHHGRWRDGGGGSSSGLWDLNSDLVRFLFTRLCCDVQRGGGGSGGGSGGGRCGSSSGVRVQLKMGIYVLKWRDEGPLKMGRVGGGERDGGMGSLCSTYSSKDLEGGHGGYVLGRSRFKTG